MKTRCVHLLVVVFVLGAVHPAWAADQPAGDVVLGKWWFPKKNGKMEVRVREGEVSRHGDRVRQARPLDKNNPDPELRKRPFVGVEMLQNFTYDPKKKEWSGGTIYDGESGKTYNCTLWFESGDTSQLNSRGYVGISLFGRTEIFTRVVDDDKVQAGYLPK